MFLLKLSGVSALSDVSYWFVLLPVLITFVIVVIGLLIYFCLGVNVVEKYKNMLGIEDLDF